MDLGGLHSETDFNIIYSVLFLTLETGGSKMSQEVAALVGPIDGTVDYGTGWRSRLTPKLEKLGIKVINPTDYFKPQGMDIHTGRKALEEARQAADWIELVKIMDGIWRFNEELVGQATFLIANWCQRISAGGTIREMQRAFEQKKPIYVIYDKDPRAVNCHLLHLIYKNGAIFTNEEEFIEFLKRRP